MTKKEIVRTISEEVGLTQLQTKEIVQRTFDAIIDTLVEDTRAKLRRGGDRLLGRIELRNFGVFEVKQRAPRKARNPKTGKRVNVPEKLVVTFKPGKEMEKRIKELEHLAAAPPKAPQTEAAETDATAQSVPEALGASAGYDSGPTEA